MLASATTTLSFNILLSRLRFSTESSLLLMVSNVYREVQCSSDVHNFLVFSNGRSNDFIGTPSKVLANRRQLGQYNRQELLALSLPFGNATWILLFQLLYIVDPKASLFAFSSVPATHQTKFWFFFFMIEEGIVMTLAGSFVIFTIGLQVMFFEKVHPIIRDEILTRFGLQHDHHECKVRLEL